MEKFIKFSSQDRNVIKMINQSENGFELIILSDSLLHNLLEFIYTYNKIHIVWQMKFKSENHILYKNCTFSDPQDNLYSKCGGPVKVYGKKIKVFCSGINFYSNSMLYKNQKVKKANHRYKDSQLLERMLKISELNKKTIGYE